MSFRRLCRTWLVAVLLATGFVVASVQPAAAETISSSGPLSSITISRDLNCDVRHVDDVIAEWYAGTACATLVSLNGTLFGPAYIPAGGGASPLTPYTPVSQSAVTGSGTAGDPYTIVTVVRAGDLATVTQTDRYVVGQEFYTTNVTVTNDSGTSLTGNIYTAGDCYLQNSDYGYGQVLGTAPACAASTDPGSRLVALIPETGGSRYYHSWYYEVWQEIGAQRPLPNTCRCDEYIDNGIGISWPVSIPVGGSSSWSWSTDFSPEGHVPLTVSATAHSPTSTPGDFNGYRVTVSNGNPENATVNEITVTLPPGFSYVSGSSTGLTHNDPAISGQTLTWTGPFDVPGGGEITIDFNVRVAETPGTYTIDATATSSHSVTPATDAAPITVTASADLGLTKTPSTGEVARGGTFTYTLTAHNSGPSPVPSAFVTDTLPAGFTFNAALSSPGCFAIGQNVHCDIGTMSNGQTTSVTVGVTVSTSAPVGYAYNFAELHGDVDDPNPLDNPVSAAVLVSNNALAISKLAEPAFAGNDLTWTIGVANDGTSPATGATVTDTLPAGLTFVRATTDNGSCDFDSASRTVTCTLGTIAAGGRTTIHLVTGTPPDLVQGNETGTTVEDTASVTNAGVTNTTTFPASVFAAAHLVSTKTVSPSPVVAGRTATYRPAERNEGPSVATQVTVTDTLPEGFTFDASASDSRCSLIDPAAGTVRCVEPGPVGVGDTVRFTVVAQVDATLGDGSDVVNDAYVQAVQFDPDAQPYARARSTVVRRVDLAITKVASRSPVRAGSSFHYTIKAVNHGPSAASSVVIADRLRRSGLRGGLRNGVKRGRDCPVAGISFRCDIPELLPGDGLTLTVPVHVPAGTGHGVRLCDTVTIRSAERDVRAANNTASACVTVTRKPHRRRHIPVTGRLSGT